MVGIRQNLRAFLAGNRSHASLQHCGLDPFIHREAGAVASLDPSVLSGDRRVVSGGTALGARRDCSGVERVLLGSSHSRLLVCRAANRVWRFILGCRCLEVRCRGAGGRHSDQGPHSRRAIWWRPFTQ